MAKSKNIKVNVYENLRQSLADALAYERGEPVDLRATKLPLKSLAPRK
jgi:hypothetical protein